MTGQPFLGSALPTSVLRKGLEKVVQKLPASFLPGRKPHLSGHLFCGRNSQRFLKIGSWNIRTLMDSRNPNISVHPPRRTALVASDIGRYDIDIAALSETRLPNEDSLTEVSGGYTFFLKVCQRNLTGYMVSALLLRRLC